MQPLQLAAGTHLLTFVSSGDTTLYHLKKKREKTPACRPKIKSSVVKFDKIKVSVQVVNCCKYYIIFVHFECGNWWIQCVCVAIIINHQYPWAAHHFSTSVRTWPPTLPARHCHLYQSPYNGPSGESVWLTHQRHHKCFSVPDTKWFFILPFSSLLAAKSTST